MTIDVPCETFHLARELWQEHENHELEIVNYANQNIAIECIDCGMVVFDFNPTEEQR